MQNAEEIYKKYSTTIYKYLFCLTHNQDISEELTQETFLIAIRKIDKFRGECKLSVWLCQIAKHLWYKELKKRNKDKNISFEEINEEMLYTETTEDIVNKKEEKLKFFKDMQKLDEKSREVMYLRMVENLTYDEIGEILGKTSNWARVTFFRAKQKIKEVKQNEKEIKLQDNEAEVEYHSKQYELEEMKEKFGENANLLDGYENNPENNPFPASFVVKTKIDKIKDYV